MSQMNQVYQDLKLVLHNEAAPITASQDGSVATVAKTHDTGPGCFNDGTFLNIAVVSSDDTTGDETYDLTFLAQKNGGGYQTFAALPIPRGTANQVFKLPVTNRGWDGQIYDEVKVNLALAGTTPILDCVIRLSVTRL